MRVRVRVRVRVGVCSRRAVHRRVDREVRKGGAGEVVRLGDAELLGDAWVGVRLRLRVGLRVEAEGRVRERGCC